MKIKHFFHLIVVTFLAFHISCKDKTNEATKENNEEVETELLADGQYQCPMDCEDGKHYENEGSCPVCKMDLKKVAAETVMTCKMHKDGMCKCEGEKCACDNCKEHNKSMTCKMHEEGECKCKGKKCKCANCKKHA